MVGEEGENSYRRERMVFYRRKERIVMRGRRELLWEEGFNGCGRRARMVVGGEREWLWE